MNATLTYPNKDKKDTRSFEELEALLQKVHEEDPDADVDLRIEIPMRGYLKVDTLPSFENMKAGNLVAMISYLEKMENAFGRMYDNYLDVLPGD